MTTEKKETKELTPKKVLREQFNKFLDENSDIVNKQFKGINTQLHDKFKEISGIELSYTQIAYFIYQYRKQHNVKRDLVYVKRAELNKNKLQIETKICLLKDEIKKLKVDLEAANVQNKTFNERIAKIENDLNELEN